MKKWRRTRKENRELCNSPLPWGGLSAIMAVCLWGWKGPWTATGDGVAPCARVSVQRTLALKRTER